MVAIKQQTARTHMPRGLQILQATINKSPAKVGLKKTHESNSERLEVANSYPEFTQPMKDHWNPVTQSIDVADRSYKVFTITCIQKTLYECVSIVIRRNPHPNG